MTILAARYSPDPSPLNSTAYRGVQLNVVDAMPWVEAATSMRLHAQYGQPGRSDARLDRRSLIESCEQFVNGYKGEAAFAMHYGLPIEGMLNDNWTRPDFTFRNRWVDVKCTMTGRSDRISIRSDVLSRDLAKWWFIGAKSTVGSTHVTLLGYLTGLQLLDYPIDPPRDGHDKSYIRVPMDDLLAMPEVTP